MNSTVSDAAEELLQNILEFDNRHYIKDTVFHDVHARHYGKYVPVDMHGFALSFTTAIVYHLFAIAASRWQRYKAARHLHWMACFVHISTLIHYNYRTALLTAPFLPINAYFVRKLYAEDNGNLFPKFMGVLSIGLWVMYVVYWCIYPRTTEEEWSIFVFDMREHVWQGGLGLVAMSNNWKSLKNANIFTWIDLGLVALFFIVFSVDKAIPMSVRFPIHAMVDTVQTITAIFNSLSIIFYNVPDEQIMTAFNNIAKQKTA